MVESAIYFPFIVLGIMFTIYVMIDLYSMASLQSHLHLAVRAQSGKLSGVTDASRAAGGGYDRYREAAFAERVELGQGKASGKATATGKASSRYGAGRMAGTARIDMDARSYAIKEIDGARKLLGK
jgi:hypothetical protein